MPSEDRYTITPKGRRELSQGIRIPEGQEGYAISSDQDFQMDVDYGILKTLGEFGPSDYESLVMENLGGIKWKDPSTGRWMSKVVGESDVRSSIRRLYEHGLIERLE